MNAGSLAVNILLIYRRVERPPNRFLTPRSTAGARSVSTIAKLPETGLTGKPLPIASNALPTDLAAPACGPEVGDFVLTFRDGHLYVNRVEPARRQLSRTPGAPPRLRLHRVRKIRFDFACDDRVFEDYCPQPAIKAAVAA